MDQGFKVDCADNDDQTPLHHAAQVGNWEGCRLLLQRDATINKKSSVTKKTPLDMAAEFGYDHDEDFTKIINTVMSPYLAKVQYFDSGMMDTDERRITGSSSSCKKYYQKCLRELDTIEESQILQRCYSFGCLCSEWRATCCICQK